MVANLAQFRTISSIALSHAPDRIEWSRDRVFVSSQEGAELAEISLTEFKVQSRIPLPGKPVWFRAMPDGETAIVVTNDPPAVLRVALRQRRVTARQSLESPIAGVDLMREYLALTLPAAKALQRVRVTDLKPVGTTATGVSCDTVRFRPDGKTILAGAQAERQVVTVDVATGALLAHLPLPIAPSRFCFNADGGQMFVSGAGEDSVAIVSPYQNEVGETMLAGRTPGAMAVSPTQNLLFVANAASGDLTILDIDTRHLSASVHVGGNPGEVLITPDGEYALVVDGQSGSVAVVRIPTVLDHKVKIKPLFTVFPTATGARSATIVPFPAGARA